VLKAEELDGFLALVDAVVNQVIAVDEFQDTATLFYFGSAVRHGIKTHRMVNELEADSLRGIRVGLCDVLNDAREVFARYPAEQPHG
jgi:hypothetical protein